MFKIQGGAEDNKVDEEMNRNLPKSLSGNFD